MRATPPQHVDAVTIERAHANHTAAPIKKQGAGSGESQPKQQPLTARLRLSPPTHGSTCSDTVGSGAPRAT